MDAEFALCTRAASIFRTIVMVFCLSAVLPRASAFADGHRMLTFCNLSDMDIVVSYVAGAMERSDKDVESVLLKLRDSLEQGDSASKGLKVAWLAIQGYCVPEGNTAHEAAGIFCQYLQLNPSQRKRSNADLLDTALRKAWTCS